ncbi:MAG: tryptophan 2,3-dioxygenase family protein [Deinococcota bacterium]|jgi:tryptophan 2,3-dioxygenase|nr:tryptophan 2,3-dioxygenase family protein [Deinococcota bacterium]
MTGGKKHKAKALTYSSYLRLDALLALQTPESAEHDELLFIVIHQVYELWFKQLLHEIDFLQRLLHGGDTPRVLRTFKRTLTILKTIVAQIDVLETMTPLEFNAFRDRLGASSGFQSQGFRELEFALGHKRAGVFGNYPKGSSERERLEARYHAPTLWDAFLGYLHVRGYAVPPALLGREVSAKIAPSPELQDVLIHIYRGDPATAEVCERLVDLDEGLQEWRYRHVKMVERTIGHKPGTGGSAGADYLRKTVKPLFLDLWEIRSRL